LLNALIPREVKVPEGSGGRRRSRRVIWGSCNGPEALRRPKPGRTGIGSGAEGPNGQRKQIAGSEVAGRDL